MDELRDLRHYYEQEAYNEIRCALQEDFLQDPVKFVQHFGCRPEDLSGQALREFYPHFLVQQRPTRSKHSGFLKRFTGGSLFGGIIPTNELQEAAA